MRGDWGWKDTVGVRGEEAGSEGGWGMGGDWEWGGREEAGSEGGWGMGGDWE